MAVLVKVVPDGVSTCPLVGLASEPQSITNRRTIRNGKMVNCVDLLLILINKCSNSQLLFVNVVVAGSSVEVLVVSSVAVVVAGTPGEKLVISSGAAYNIW